MTVSGSRVRQARELKGWTQKQLSSRIGKSQASIAYIERGIKNASSEVIESIARHTQFPLVFFREDPQVEIPVETLKFRSKASMTRRQAVEVCRVAEIQYEMFETFSRYATPLPIQLVPQQGTPIEAARKTRLQLGLSPDQPIEHLIRTVEIAGIVVLFLPVNLEQVDAFSTFISHESKVPVIGICGDAPGDRLRWSVAHELGHLLLHSDRKLVPEEHFEADVFAGEFMLPEIAMRNEITNPVTISGIAELKPKWGVSIQALVRRARDLHIISDRQYRYLFQKIAIKGWKKKEPENLAIPIEKPRALAQMAEIAYGYPLDYSRVATECRLSIQTAKAMLAGFDFTPKTGVELPSHNTSGKVIPMRF